MKRFLHVALLVFGGSNENNTAAVTFGTLGYTGNTSFFYRMVVFNADWNRVLSACNLVIVKKNYCKLNKTNLNLKGFAFESRYFPQT